MELSVPFLQTAIQAVDDAIRVTQTSIDANPDDLMDLEHYLLQLSQLEAELKAEWLRLRAKNKDLLAYELLVGPPRFRKL